MNTSVTITLGRDGMGPESNGEDFNAWVRYVSRRLDIDGVTCHIETAAPRDIQDPWRIGGGGDHDEIRWALNDLWDEFCATPEAWSGAEGER